MTADTGIVAGTLRLVGGPPPGRIIPAPGKVFAFTSDDLSGEPAGSTDADASGAFTMELPPGTYYVAATSPKYGGPGTPACRAQRPAVVRAGHMTRVDVSCHMR